MDHSYPYPRGPGHYFKSTKKTFKAPSVKALLLCVTLKVIAHVTKNFQVPKRYFWTVTCPCPCHVFVQDDVYVHVHALVYIHVHAYVHVNAM
jgi:hypothetical protein